MVIRCRGKLCHLRQAHRRLIQRHKRCRPHRIRHQSLSHIAQHQHALRRVQYLGQETLDVKHCRVRYNISKTDTDQRHIQDSQRREADLFPQRSDPFMKRRY
ncbi:hypothetical protein NDU88_009536 [Pleurodeles waltl]|uniref:Uncharacterized protein n=1 Tax=Pleurodeles waltl TaxID=8319 RepID=A0AAV7P2I2_PLEWA|nr:hypothetical protein NDU88_009536 [Pleurodeles waltl]